MTSEYLLDTIGLLDDDLILDAETEYVPKSKPIRKQLMLWLPTAACVALLLISSPLFRGANKESSTTACGDAAMSATAETEDYKRFDYVTSNESPSMAAGTEGAASDLTEFYVSVTVDGMACIYSHSYPSGEPHGVPIETLPAGCIQAGIVTSVDEDATVPHTDTGVYTGCALWLEGRGEESTLYLELPEGGYLVCEYSQTSTLFP